MAISSKASKLKSLPAALTVAVTSQTAFMVAVTDALSSVTWCMHELLLDYFLPQTRAAVPACELKDAK